MLNLFLTLFVLGYPSPHGHAVRVGDARTGVATVPPAPLAVDFKISDVTLTPGSLFVRKRSRCFNGRRREIETGSSQHHHSETQLNTLLCVRVSFHSLASSV